MGTILENLDGKNLYLREKSLFMTRGGTEEKLFPWEKFFLRS